MQVKEQLFLVSADWSKLRSFACKTRIVFFCRKKKKKKKKKKKRNMSKHANLKWYADEQNTIL
ncbi:MAG: hypothetical protein ACI8RD_001667 [Bacillariaceae sp.]|jgi:hypothetical protein